MPTCDILKQSTIPSIRRLGRRAVFKHDNNPKYTSKTTTAFLKKLRVKVMDWCSVWLRSMMVVYTLWLKIAF